MGSHVKSLTKVIILPAIEVSGSTTIDMPDLSPTSIILKRGSSVDATLSLQVSPDGTNYFEVEALTVTSTKKIFQLTSSKYYGYKKLKLVNGATANSGVEAGGSLILCEI